MVHGFRTGIAFDGGFSEYVRVPAAYVMALPPGLDAWQAAVIGVPGFTAGMVLDRFIQAGLTPSSGPIAVSGASGAVGMLATAGMARAGWQVHGLTRKPEQTQTLQVLGASDILGARIVNGPARALEKARFAAALDNVGGTMLSWLLKSVQDGGCVASVGGRLKREAKRRARIDPELIDADFVIHPDLGFGTSPTPAFFEKARRSGEHAARQLLPNLKERMALAGASLRSPPAAESSFLSGSTN